MCPFSSLHRNSSVHPGVNPSLPQFESCPLVIQIVNTGQKTGTELRYHFAFCLTASIPDSYMNVKSGIPGKKKLTVVDFCSIFPYLY